MGSTCACFLTRVEESPSRRFSRVDQLVDDADDVPAVEPVGLPARASGANAARREGESEVQDELHNRA